MNTDTRAILVDGVSKTFRLPHEQVHTLKERALHPLRKPGSDALPVLRDVSFDVHRGEFFGIVGRNGSGKSTLLKCLAGIYRVDQGAIWVDGRMSTFIELGVGFNPDLPARDNVMINATMMGLSPKEARRRFDGIIDFAELGDFTELKLKNYSSGMMVRLAFSVAIQVDADILLIDEVLAVGDAAFQQKCFDEFGRIRKSGATVLFVTHDMGSVERFCDRALLLENGAMVDLGDTSRVAARYMQLNFSADARAAAAAAAADDRTTTVGMSGGSAGDEDERFGDRKAELVEGWFEDEAGDRSDLLAPGEQASFCFRAQFHETIEDPVFGVALHNADGDFVLGLSDHAHATGTYEPGDEIVVRMTFHNVLAPNRYSATPAIAYSGEAYNWIDLRTRWVTVVVTGIHPNPGALLNMPCERSIERVSESALREAPSA